MNNRLEELGLNNDSEDEDIEHALEDIVIHEKERFNEDTPPDSKFVEEFHSDVEEVKSLLQEIEDDCDNLRTEYQKSFTEVHVIGNDKRERTFVDERRMVTDKLRDVKGSIKDMEEIMIRIKKKENVKEDEEELFKTAEYRMRENMYVTLVKRTQNVITKFQKIETEYEEKKRYEIKRKLRIATNQEEIEEEELQEFMENPKKIYLQFLSGSSTVSRTVQVHYDEAVETREDLLDLEMSMNQIVDMFTDLHELLKIQGDNVDNIQDSVVQSVSYVDKGTEAIKRGTEHQSKTKCLCIIAVILGTILTIIVIMILALLIFGGAGGLSALAAGLAIGL